MTHANMSYGKTDNNGIEVKYKCEHSAISNLHKIRLRK